jgi:thiamine-phosphate pyrophosphorylase
MLLDLPKPIIYLITSGTTTQATTPESSDFDRVLTLVEAAVAAQIPLVQIREKLLSARVLYELVTRAVELTRGAATALLVNDRSDIAVAAGSYGVHLTSRSLPADVIRQTHGGGLLIGVSTHSLEEARAARDGGADFIVFGPVFETPSKLNYGAPQGPGKLREVTTELGEFPVIAIGGISEQNAAECFQAGASGIGAIGLFNDPNDVMRIAAEIESVWER